MLLGILNVTDDSFSDGGRFVAPEEALRHGLSMTEQGADAIDVGGESTRPGAQSVGLDTEFARVVPIVQMLARAGVLVSVDSTRREVVHAALDAGAQIVNDVGMGDSPEELGPEIVRAHAGCIVMHARGTPSSMTGQTSYSDLVNEVIAELLARVERYLQVGVPAEKIMVDPGIGFAKNARQSLELLSDIARFVGLGYSVCVGPSRKSFIASPESHPVGWPVRETAPSERLGGTAAAVAHCVWSGVNVLRVHDVTEMAQAARVAQAIRMSSGRTSGR